jgi:transcriptional adapter 3
VSHVSLLPTRPPVPLAPVPGPSKTTDVKEDFSKMKQPSQVLVTTFYTSIEPWIRPLIEEDIGFLDYTADEETPFVVPKLGRHYSQVWEEEDIATYGIPLPGTAAAHASGHAGSSDNGKLFAKNTRWEPATLTDADAITEEKGHGPLTERVISSLLQMPGEAVWNGVKQAEGAMEGRSGGGATAAAARDKMTIGDLEERIRESLRWLGIPDEEPATEDPVDDPIATALRHAQKQLRLTLATNKARKARILNVARDRLGYQEYVEVRDALDRNITNLYSKLQRKDAPKVSKKKKVKGESAGANGDSKPPGVIPPSPAALGLGQDERAVLNVPEQLTQLVKTRRQWVDMIGGAFEARERERKGSIIGVPDRGKSLFIGIADEVLERANALPSSIREQDSKGKGKGTAMEASASTSTNGLLPGSSPMELG